ncbi:Nucleoside diphosphate kinase 7 [Nymphon striatum]|nr:Nucleoside diphosphate kinase 7 [Nymphon striatum]
MSDDDFKYTFLVEWFDPESEVNRQFFLHFFSESGSVSMYDIKNRRMFLKKIFCKDINLHNFHIGRTLNVFSRQLVIKQFGDLNTQNRFGMKTQKTLAILMESSLSDIGNIFELIYQSGLKITRGRMIKISKENISSFDIQDSPANLKSKIEAFSPGSIFAMELVGEMAISVWHKLIDQWTGSCEINEIEPENSDPNILDKSYGSVDLEDVEKELDFMFSSHHCCWESSAVFSLSTCCVIKPHAVIKNLSGAIIKEIQSKGFNISALQMFYLSEKSASKFYQVYQNVLPEYKNMVSELVKGPCIAMEITCHPCKNLSEIVNNFREFVGPSDPEVAKSIRPDSLRAKYGTDRIRNAIHCSDLLEESIVETEFFFKSTEN